MADRFYKDLEIPEIPSSPGSPPDSGFVQIYGRGGRIYMLNSAGVEYDLTQGMGTVGVSYQNIDGGFANSTYLSTQRFDGGFSTSVYLSTQQLDGGDANG